MVLLFWNNSYLLDQWRRRKISCSFYLHLALLWCSSWLYVDLSFWHTLFSFYLKNSFEHFQQGRSAFHKFPHFFFVWESICPSFVKDNFGGIQNFRLVIFFFPQHFKHYTHSLLPRMVSQEKSAIIFIFAPLYVRCFSPLISFKIFLYF